MFGLKKNFPLAGLTSWRIGGPAESYFKPRSIAELKSFLALNPAEPLTWLGLGSNVLIRDQGVPGTVIHTFGGLGSLGFTEGLLRAEAGLSCAKLARFCAQRHLSGAEFFAGIPGTLGGALCMNAGAWGQETWTHVRQVETLNRQGQLCVQSAEHFQATYRKVSPEAYFVAAHFEFPKDTSQLAQARMHELLKLRRLSQPIGLLNAGSVFTNPEHDSAGRLIEAAGLKGYRIGNVEISNKHANFIINLGQGQARDVEALMTYIKQEVWTKFKVALSSEIRILGIE